MIYLHSNSSYIQIVAGTLFPPFARHTVFFFLSANQYITPIAYSYR